jgi:hypothetical protein
VLLHITACSLGVPTAEVHPDEDAPDQGSPGERGWVHACSLRLRGPPLHPPFGGSASVPLPGRLPAGRGRSTAQHMRRDEIMVEVMVLGILRCAAATDTNLAPASPAPRHPSVPRESGAQVHDDSDPPCSAPQDCERKSCWAIRAGAAWHTRPTIGIDRSPPLTSSGSTISEATRTTGGSTAKALYHHRGLHDQQWRPQPGGGWRTRTHCRWPPLGSWLPSRYSRYRLRLQTSPQRRHPGDCGRGMTGFHDRNARRVQV